MSLSRFACAVGALSLLAGCQTMQDSPKQTIGTVLGAATGAIVGSHLGGGTGRTVAIAAGTLAGAWLGSSIGQSLDEVDRMKMNQATQNALENQAVGTQTSWSNPDSGASGTVTPTKTYYEGSAPCREYSSTVTIDGKLETITGTACRRPDGTWRTVD